MSPSQISIATRTSAAGQGKKYYTANEVPVWSHFKILKNNLNGLWWEHILNKHK